MMRTIRAFLVRLGGLFHKGRRDRELAEEIESNLQLHIEDNIRAGMSPEDARREALLKFGGIESAKEAYRDRRSLPLLEDLAQDLRYGARMLRTQPGFTLIAALTLSLGIGANTAIFSVVNSVLLRPLPGFETDRLIIISQKTQESDQSDVWTETVKEWRRQANSFEQLEAGQFLPYTVGGDPPESSQAAVVTSGYFALYRAQAAHGRLFLPGEDQPGRDRVVVLDHAYWQRRFGADPQVIGQTIRLNKEDYVVVGVAPADFHPLGRGWVQFYLPLALDKYSNFSVWVVARLKPGLSFEQARAEMAAISRRLAEVDPKNYKGVEANPVPILETWVAQIRLLLRLLFAAVAVVLLLACVNVANLLLARSATRQQEFAIRLALGATRFRLVRQMMVESLLLAFAGGGLGLLLAVSAVSALGRLKWLSIPRLDEVNIDTTVLGFNLLAALVTGILCSVGPVLAVMQRGVNRSLESSGRNSTGSRTQERGRNILIVTQVAGAFVLVYAAGLLTQSFVRMQRVDLGYEPHNVLTFAITLPETTDKTGRQIVATYDRIIERIRRLPGVEHLGLTTSLPTGEGSWAIWEINVEGRPVPPNREAKETLRIVNADYFRALRIPLLEGRLFDEHDTLDNRNVVIITESVARRFFSGQNPIGQRLLLGWLDPNMREGDSRVIPCEIVGIVGDVKQASVADDGRMEMFVPYQQNGVRFTMMAVRAAGNPMKLVNAIQREVAQEDKDLPLSDVKTMEERASRLTTQSQTSMMIFSVFAILALLLAAIGIYGAMSYAVARRTREIGIRMALGAQTGDVRMLVVKQGMKLTLLGVAIGWPAAAGLTRSIKNLLFGIEAADPATFAGVAFLLGSVAVLACLVPARRATKVDPMVALRSE
jgi:predicted permease